MEQRKNKKPAPQLPQWNSKFRYSAQKPTEGGAHKAAPKDDSVTRDTASKEHASSKTPLGQARRVPVAAGKAAPPGQAAEKEKQQQQQQQVRAAASSPDELDVDKTPTLCLFQRFESLTLGTPAGRAAAAVTGPDQSVLAAASIRTAAQHRSVAFGTPSVLSYTPAAGAPAATDGTPLWSNAGHTPFSMTSRDTGCAIRAVCIDGDDSGTQGAVVAGDDDDDDSTAVSVGLFTSVITSTEPQQTPDATMLCPRSPAELPLAQPATDGVLDAAAAVTAVRAASQDMDNPRVLQTPQTNKQPAGLSSSSSSFKGFNPGQMPAVDGSCGPPPSFSTSSGSSWAVGDSSAAGVADAGTCATMSAGGGRTLPAATVTPAAKEWMELVATGAVGSSHLPMPTPKSKLKQPERVKSTKPVIRTELKQLLSDPIATAAQPTDDTLLGSCDVLSPVRVRKHLQHTMGAGDQVLTPVRRSARKVKDTLQGTAGRVQPMLEATNYCYQPNSAISSLDKLDRVQTGQ